MGVRGWWGKKEKIKEKKNEEVVRGWWRKKKEKKNEKKLIM